MGPTGSANRSGHRRSITSRLLRAIRNMPPGRRLRLQLAIATVEEHVRDRPDVRLLDAGSEEGLLCLELARRHPGWELIAADVASEPLARGRAWAEAEGLSVRFVECDLQQDLVGEPYDVIVSLESLMEIPDDTAAVNSIVHGLRPGGLLVLQVPTADWTPALRGADLTWRREVRHGYDPQELISVLERAGLEVRAVRPTFRRLTACAQDFRDRFKHRGRKLQLALLPLMVAAVALERHGLTWGRPRALFVVAVKT